MCHPALRPHALILGGTRGLGREIALELMRRARADAPDGQAPWPVVFGRGAEAAKADPALEGVSVHELELAEPDSAETVLATIPSCGSVSQVYWVAGEYHRGPFAEQSVEKTAHMLAVHLLGPLSVLGALHRRAKAGKEPYDLVVIGSVFVHKPGKQHAVLAAAKAAKANFTRVFAHELAADLPGSRALLVNPWAMKTGFFEGYAMDTKAIATFMEPADVARIVLDRLETVPRDAKPPMLELTLDRDKDRPGAIVELLGPQPVKY